jgi:membrane protease YdiL (CAAX protease family)
MNNLAKAERADGAEERRGFRRWLADHYRFVYAIDLILLYLSAMFYITARIVTGSGSAPSRTLLVLLIGSGIIAALPFVAGENFEKDFASALANPGSKKLKRIEMIVAAALLLILAAAVAVAILHPAHSGRP